eukprot:COSAG02_NODE_4019_length_5896_cov_75.960152_1_plen_160_part_10
MEGSGSSRWLAAAATATAAALISGCQAERLEEPAPAESEILRRRRLQELLASAEAEGSVDVGAVSGALESAAPKLNEVEPLARDHGVSEAADRQGLQPEPELDKQVGHNGIESELRAELASLRVKALEKRALAEGVDADAIEGALDDDQPKAALIKLIVD